MPQNLFCIKTNSKNLWQLKKNGCFFNESSWGILQKVIEWFKVIISLKIIDIRFGLDILHSVKEAIVNDDNLRKSKKTRYSCCLIREFKIVYTTYAKTIWTIREFEWRLIARHSGVSLFRIKQDELELQRRTIGLMRSYSFFKPNGLRDPRIPIQDKIVRFWTHTRVRGKRVGWQISALKVNETQAVFGVLRVVDILRLQHFFQKQPQYYFLNPNPNPNPPNLFDQYYWSWGNSFWRFAGHFLTSSKPKAPLLYILSFRSWRLNLLNISIDEPNNCQSHFRTCPIDVGAQVFEDFGEFFWLTIRHVRPSNYS